MDLAFLLYTSGTTGPPKAAPNPHRSLIGKLPGFECSQNGFPRQDDRLFTQADWAWTGGLPDGLLPTWYYGVPVLAFDSMKFNAERIVTLLQRHRITTGFFPPTALRMMRAAGSRQTLAELSCTQHTVRTRLAACQYPRIIEFMPALPMTTTGKVQRAELRRLHAESACDA